MTAKTYDEWTDCLGRTYRPGDWVAVAVINGRSPQMVIAEVERINSVDSKGAAITDVVWEWTTFPGDYKNANRVTVPSCTVRCKPLMDARDFYRTGTSGPDADPSKVRSVTYRIPDNILKVEKPNGAI